MAFECKHSQRWKKRVKHPQSYSFIFVLLNLPHAQKRKSELFRGEDSEFPEIKSSCHGYDYVRDQRMRTVIEGEKAPSFYHWLPLQNVCWCVNIVCETFKGVFSRVKHSRHLCCFHRQQGLTEWAAGGGSIISQLGHQKYFHRIKTTWRRIGRCPEDPHRAKEKKCCSIVEALVKYGKIST